MDVWLKVYANKFIKICQNNLKWLQFGGVVRSLFLKKLVLVMFYMIKMFFKFIRIKQKLKLKKKIKVHKQEPKMIKKAVKTKKRSDKFLKYK